MNIILLNSQSCIFFRLKGVDVYGLIQKCFLHNEILGMVKREIMETIKLLGEKGQKVARKLFSNLPTINGVNLKNFKYKYFVGKDFRALLEVFSIILSEIINEHSIKSKILNGLMVFHIGYHYIKDLERNINPIGNTGQYMEALRFHKRVETKKKSEPEDKLILEQAEKLFEKYIDLKYDNISIVKEVFFNDQFYKEESFISVQLESSRNVISEKESTIKYSSIVPLSALNNLVYEWKINPEVYNKAFTIIDYFGEKKFYLPAQDPSETISSATQKKIKNFKSSNNSSISKTNLSINQSSIINNSFNLAFYKLSINNFSYQTYIYIDKIKKENKIQFHCNENKIESFHIGLKSLYQSSDEKTKTSLNNIETDDTQNETISDYSYSEESSNSEDSV
ncbi:hypothetical protein DICPUDRAFT_153839 [Dictyostelium purpureum]|uniref:Uncharacterized protein n=1 Tax=Dictyostelium purpureum TaxID=5786 RepID=F0ZPV6_DICPU|nr:uncharacterized protein DICPUDRAFT_153839 [Dictyostelium purpureum]EGC34006.1 hypothetical protein DICPUDRAFT_153839 [Dictyostelium purpureum]|eukprot:XP_003289450.1 hypothetical protein DICPUDRAFT_153839 [Dictyostelium purpureum]